MKTYVISKNMLKTQITFVLTHYDYTIIQRETFLVLGLKIGSCELSFIVLQQEPNLNLLVRIYFASFELSFTADSMLSYEFSVTFIFPYNNRTYGSIFIKCRKILVTKEYSRIWYTLFGAQVVSFLSHILRSV